MMLLELFLSIHPRNSGNFLKKPTWSSQRDRETLRVFGERRKNLFISCLWQSATSWLDTWGSKKATWWLQGTAHSLQKNTKRRRLNGLRDTNCNKEGLHRNNHTQQACEH